MCKLELNGQGTKQNIEWEILIAEDVCSIMPFICHIKFYLYNTYICMYLYAT